METLIGLLKGEYGVEAQGARSWWGLHTRITSVLAAYTVGRYLVALGVYS